MLNISLTSCSSAELIYVSVQRCKSQPEKLHLQTVKFPSHLPVIASRRRSNPEKIAQLDKSMRSSKATGLLQAKSPRNDVKLQACLRAFQCREAL
jgi:hypothetical protein